MDSVGGEPLYSYPFKYKGQRPALHYPYLMTFILSINIILFLAPKIRETELSNAERTVSDTILLAATIFSPFETDPK